ncbi:hypothetical protein JD844_001547 [Phrynosoma platyrhinos]|uniref:GFO/IDH/MocA-like oxidoreductase domain-containing protein n=1 Tax=Phrynosoma platyrhinos TaxID=52577 RepID=A0ABQ7T9V7_PHRPL|nr:hypothetical protein JD844_001547 [Phrynosoma platyrhinos]
MGMNAAEGFWTRFFPVSEQIRTMLGQKSLGDLKVLQAQLGFQMDHIPRLVDKKLGGGVVLDLGCYVVQFASMVFGPEKPKSIVASGLLHDTGVDETVAIILNYSGNRQAVLNCTMMVNLPGEAIIGGTEGNIQELLTADDLKESPIMPLHESESVATIMDEVRKQVGVIYEQDTVQNKQSNETGK